MTIPSRPVDGPPIPEMREALLSSAEVLALAADLQSHARIQGTLCKAGPRQQTPPGDAPLETAIHRLLERSVTAVQVQYAYDGHEWTDTLLNTPAGVRLVRCQH